MTPPPSVPLHAQPRFRIALFIVVVSLAAEWFVSPAALLTTLFDIVYAAMVFVPAIFLGWSLVRRLGATELPDRWKFLLSAALGLGLLSLLVLLGGILGILLRPVWIAVLGFVTVTGVWSLRRKRSEITDNAGITALLPWLCVIPFLVLAFLAASNPPGTIWQEEGFGYDSLEYHLQLPREYLQMGRISFMPHNVYANFPASTEMLYLQSMMIQNNSVDAGTAANMIHLGLAALCVAAAWAIGRDFSPLAGLIGALTAASCTWIEYLSGLAYVENGMLFFGLCAAGMILRLTGEVSDASRWKWIAVAGLLAGFSGGCKYTAFPMIIAPLAVVIFIVPADWRRRFSCAAIFCGCAAVTASPWLIKNVAWTGNPVFPLANQLFEAHPSGWSAGQTSQWNRGHSAGGAVGLKSKLAELWQRVPGDHLQRFGPVVLVLGLVGLAGRRRDRIDAWMVMVLIAQLLVWLFATHLYARFAVPLLIPLLVLAARSVLHAAPARSAIVLTAVIAGSIWNFSFAATRHVRESAPGAPTALFVDGLIPGYEYLGYANHELPANARLLLVGDARPYYLQRPVDYFVAFNFNPFFDLINRNESPEAIVDWLRSQGYTHIIVHWSELNRIARTYKFYPDVSNTQVEQTLQALTRAGLKLTRSFSHPSHAGERFIDVIEVSSAQGGD